MLPLLAAFIILALAFRRLTRPPPTSVKPKPTDTKSSAHKKLLQDAFEHAHHPSEHSPDPSRNIQPILILYATEYGFGAQVARSVAATLSTAPDPMAGEQSAPEPEPDEPEVTPPLLSPRVVNVLHYSLIDFTRESFVVIICSTTGDGVPPNEATAFRDALVTTDIVLPPSSRFAVLALGDHAYPHFCRAGAIFDALLPAPARLLDRVDVDQEDWPLINDWTARLHRAITAHVCDRPALAPPSDDYLHAAIDKYAASLDSIDAQFTRNNPFLATIVERHTLTAPVLHPTHKEAVRVVFDLAASCIDYCVGDALAVVPRNNSTHVNRLLRAMASNGDELVTVAESPTEIPFERALSEELDICVPRPSLIFFLARHAATVDEVVFAIKLLGYDPRDPTNRSKTSISDFGKAYLAEREVFDVLSDFLTASVTAQQLTNVLRPLHARYYSISSTPTVDEGRVAITVDVLRYQSLNIEREGVASTYLRDRCRIDDTKVAVFLSKNPNFRLPADGNTPIIMIGPGTGVAPFIAFIQEREAKEASGENVLFFGCRFENQDFLYGDELREYADKGLLHLETAFSRDGDEKVYVQHRMKELAHRLWDLIDSEHAHVYVCGDGGQMASDVDDTLKEIVMEHGERGGDEAAVYLSDLSDAKRYQRDVWVS